MAQFGIAQQGRVWEWLFVAFKSASVPLLVSGRAAIVVIATHTLTLTDVLRSDALAKVKVSIWSMLHGLASRTPVEISIDVCLTLVVEERRSAHVRLPQRMHSRHMPA